MGGLADVQAEHGPRPGRWRFHGGILPVVVRPDGLPLGTHITSRGLCPALSYQPSGAARPAPAAPNGPSRGQGRSAVRGRPVGGPFWARLNRSPRRARADNFDCNGINIQDCNSSVYPEGSPATKYGRAHQQAQAAWTPKRRTSRTSHNIIEHRRTQSENDTASRRFYDTATVMLL